MAWDLGVVVPIRFPLLPVVDCHLDVSVRGARGVRLRPHGLPGRERPRRYRLGESVWGVTFLLNNTQTSANISFILKDKTPQSQSSKWFLK